MAIERKEIEKFIHEMLEHWNAGDGEAFMASYRRVCPGKFSLENPVGTPVVGWEGLEAMRADYQGKVKTTNLKLIVNGHEAATVMRNEGTIDRQSFVHDSIETYAFGPDGSLYVRYWSPTAASP